MRFFPILIAMLILASGCITSKGKKLTGVVPTDHGTHRLQSAIDREKRETAEKEKAEEEKKKAKEVKRRAEEALKKAEEARREALLKSIQSKQVKLPPARSKPATSTAEANSAEANDVPIKIAPADSRTAFTPSVTKPNLSPADSLIEDLKNLGNEENKIIINGEIKDREVKSKIAINWAKLITFYLGFALLFVLIYYGFKMAKKRTEEMTGKKNTPKKRRATKKAAKKHK